MAIPAKLSYNPLANLDNIIWIAPNNNSTDIVDDFGCLRNYTKLSKSGYNFVMLVSSHPSWSAYEFLGVYSCERSKNATTPKLNISYSNTKLYTLLEDLIRYYKVYYYFNHGILIKNTNTIATPTSKNTDVTTPELIQIFNLIKTKASYAEYNTPSYHWLFKPICLYHFNTNHSLTKTTIFSFETTEGFSSASYMQQITSVCLSSKLSDDQTTARITLENIYYNTYQGSSSNANMSNPITINPRYIDISFSGNNNQYTFNSNISQTSYIPYPTIGGISPLYITTKPNHTKALNTWLTYSAKTAVDPEYDVGTYIGEKSLNSNLIRHVYNDDPLCFIFG